MIAAPAPAPATAPPETKTPVGAAQTHPARSAVAQTGPLVQRCATAACGTPHHRAGQAGGACDCAACSGTSAAAKVDRDDALSHLLARAVAQRAAAAAPPHYKDSETEAPGVRDPDKKLESARRQALRFVNAARAALRAGIDNAPADPTSLYGMALARHFLNATYDDQVKILKAYDVILTSLVVDNYVVTQGQTPVEGEAHPCQGRFAYWNKVDDLVYLCPMFWKLSPFCQAVTLIHEGAHDADVDAHLSYHQQPRGTAFYTEVGAESPAGVTTENRIENPDVYAFFAAHIASGKDTKVLCDPTREKRGR
jgi:hypothetical protein